MNMKVAAILLLALLRSSGLVDCLRVAHLKEVSVDSTSVVIQWSVENSLVTDGEWVGFKVKFSVDKLQYAPILLKNAALRKFQLANLQVNTEYQIQVSAYNLLGNEGPASNLLTIKTKELVLDEPQDFKILRLTGQRIELEWKPPLRHKEHVDKFYEIHYSQVLANESESVIRRPVDINQLTCILDLVSGSLYRIQIFAFSGVKGDVVKRYIPMLVSTHDVELRKPLVVKQEIFVNTLRVEWRPPEVVVDSQKIDSYRLYFNGDMHKLDPRTNKIDIKQPKWDYNRKYELRIAANMVNSKNETIYGPEASYQVLTDTNDRKIFIPLDRLNSTNALVKWNSSDFPNTKHYKVVFWPSAKPDAFKTYEAHNSTEFLLTNLTANSAYSVQLFALGKSPLTVTNTLTVTHFRTLLVDLHAPVNLQATRVESDRILVKWEPVDLNARVYRVYFKPLSANLDYYDIDSDEWRSVETRGVELTLDNVYAQNDYLIKVVPVDKANNEGTETVTLTVGQLTTTGSVIEPTEIGKPRHLVIVECTANSVILSWLPPKLPAHYRISHFTLSYQAHAKFYKEANGSVVHQPPGANRIIMLPARDDSNIPIKWLVNGLAAFAEYEFNLTTVVRLAKTEGLPAHVLVKTKPDRPARVDRPRVLDVYADAYSALVRTGNASELNGPLHKYWLVVAPLCMGVREIEPHRDIAGLRRYSLINSGTAESEYITAEFAAEFWPAQFIVGDGRMYGRFANRVLVHGCEYKLRTVVFADEQSDLASRMNRVDLGEMLSPGGRPDVEDGDLFAFSAYSEAFSSKSLLANKKTLKQN